MVSFSTNLVLRDHVIHNIKTKEARTVSSLSLSGLGFRLFLLFGLVWFGLVFQGWISLCRPCSWNR